VGRQAKTGIGLAIVVLLALLAWSQAGVLAGVGVLVIGVILAVLVLRRTAGSASSGTREKSRRRKKDDSFLEASLGTTDAPTTTEAPGLQPWSPPEGLQPWTPPEDLAEAEPLVDRRESTSSWDDGEAAVDTVNPLDDLERLDDVDVIAEVERIEAREAGSVTEIEEVEYEPEPAAEPEVEPSGGLFSVPAPIKEDVRSDDEIMAASQATELSVADDNSELAKLLAKVQARLAAYE
jgi:hypothetical protein